MNLPVQTPLLELLAIPLGITFGVLLHRGGVTDYNVIVNQFRLKDFTVARIMFTAIVIGGAGILLLNKLGYAHYHIKPANLLGVTLGATLFGIGMVLYGYCPGTGLAAVATGSLHALSGVLGMLAGGALYALTFPWVEARVQSVGQLGQVTIPELTNIPDSMWFLFLSFVLAVVLYFDRKKTSVESRL